MKAEMYYKEEFPLELRITIENINDLRYLQMLFSMRNEFTIKEKQEKYLSTPEQCEEVMAYVKQYARETGGEEIDNQAFNICRNVWKEQEQKLTKKQLEKDEG